MFTKHVHKCNPLTRQLLCTGHIPLTPSGGPSLVLPPGGGTFMALYGAIKQASWSLTEGHGRWPHGRAGRAQGPIPGARQTACTWLPDGGRPLVFPTLVTMATHHANRLELPLDTIRANANARRPYYYTAVPEQNHDKH